MVGAAATTDGNGVIASEAVKKNNTVNLDKVADILRERKPKLVHIRIHILYTSLYALLIVRKKVSSPIIIRARLH